MAAAEEIPVWTRRLLQAQSDEECVRTNLHLRGVVVRQGAVFQAAEPFVELVFEVISQGVGTGYGIGQALDLVVEVVEGEPAKEEIDSGNGDVVEHCRRVLRGHIELLYSLAESMDELVVFGAVELLAVIDARDARLLALVDRLDERELLQKSGDVYKGEWIHRNYRALLGQIRAGAWG